MAKTDTILAWYRKLIAQKFDGSQHRQYPGRPRMDGKLEALIVRTARENSGWGYDRIVGALTNLGHSVSDQTVGNVLRRHGIAPAPQRGRRMSWRDFLAAHRSVLAGGDFFTVEVLKWRGLVTYYVLFFLHLETRRVTIAGITRHPDGEWMEQIARSATQETWGYLNRCRYVPVHSLSISLFSLAALSEAPKQHVGSSRHRIDFEIIKATNRRLNRRRGPEIYSESLNHGSSEAKIRRDD